MRIIISPAKKMKMDVDTLPYKNTPQFMEYTKILCEYLKKLEYATLKEIWKCNDNLAELNYNRIKEMNLETDLTPAILSYEGIQYQYMSPSVFVHKELDYLEEHLRILSGFYGMLKPFDGVVPYRLEMQARLGGKDIDSLYTFWEDKLSIQLFSESDCIINLASKEYSKCISSNLKKNVRLITCVFGELFQDKVIEKGTKVKMARGEMVRFMAENQIKNPEEVKNFHGLHYSYSEQFSDESKYVFLSGSQSSEKF
ncbi:MAG: peroxide stress protein YaaA [Anaerocolumna sp.]